MFVRNAEKMIKIFLNIEFNEYVLVEKKLLLSRKPFLKAEAEIKVTQFQAKLAQLNCEDAISLVTGNNENKEVDHLKEEITLMMIEKIKLRTRGEDYQNHQITIEILKEQLNNKLSAFIIIDLSKLKNLEKLEFAPGQFKEEDMALKRNESIEVPLKSPGM